jgi:hypothetical protein
MWASRTDDIWLTSVDVLYHYDGKNSTVVKNRPGIHQIRAFWGAAPDNVWSFADDGEIGHWDGATWTLTNSLGDSFESAAGLSPTDIWAAAEYKLYHYDGSTWTSQSAGIDSYHPMRAVFPISSTVAWAGGIDEVLMRWDGTRWTRDSSIPEEVNSTINLMWGNGPSDIWAFGQANVYHYDGTNWRIDPSAVTVSTGWGSGPRDFWGISSGTPYHYDGERWTKLPVMAELHGAISGTGPGQVFLGAFGGFLRWSGN